MARKYSSKEQQDNDIKLMKSVRSNILYGMPLRRIIALKIRRKAINIARRLMYGRAKKRTTRVYK